MRWLSRLFSVKKRTEQEEIISNLNDITDWAFPYHAWTFYDDAYHMVSTHEASHGMRGGHGSQLNMLQIAAVMSAFAESGLYEERARMGDGVKLMVVRDLFNARPSLEAGDVQAGWLRKHRNIIKSDLRMFVTTQCQWALPPVSRSGPGNTPPAA